VIDLPFAADTAGVKRKLEIALIRYPFTTVAAGIDRLKAKGIAADIPDLAGDTGPKETD
jgi:hypothetical protein